MTPSQLPFLDTFLIAAELNSFTAAARALTLSQAAVSQRIQALEKVLKAPLFERSGGHLMLTDCGRKLHAYAQRILALHEEAILEITGQQPRLRGELLLGASSVPGHYLLPDLLAAFRERYPHIKVRAHLSDTQQVLQSVEQGHVHLGLVGGRSDNAHLEFRSFASDTLVLAVPAKHPWARRKQVSLAALMDEPLILREPGSGSRSCLEQAMTAAKKSPRDLNVALELGSNEAIKEAVLRGLGVAFLSSRAIVKELEAGQLRALRIAGLTLERDVFVVADRRRALPIPAQQFLDFLVAFPTRGSEYLTR